MFCKNTMANDIVAMAAGIMENKAIELDIIADQFAEGHEIRAASIKSDSEEIRKAVALMHKLAGSWA